MTFRDAMTQRLGDLEVRYRAAKGETDDHCYLFVPERGYLFTGDLVIWASPNCGNPQKVQRYPVEWAEALETMAGLGAEWLFPGHGFIVCGREAVRDVLTDTARYLRVIIDQVLARLNAGQTPEAIFHGLTTTIQSSLCETCCAGGAGGGMETRLICYQQPGKLRRGRSRASPGVRRR